MLLIHPTDLPNYQTELSQYGVAYHKDRRWLTFVAKESTLARVHCFTSQYSPCEALELCREFDGEPIIGVTFVDPISMLHRYELEVADLQDGYHLMNMYDDWMENQWRPSAHTIFREKKLNTQQIAQRIASAEKLYDKARVFFLEHPKDGIIPEEIRSRLRGHEMELKTAA